LEDNEEVANFVKILNKGTNGRYRGKLPLICFNCDGIGHFGNKCPHKKNINDEGYSKGRQTYKGKRTTKKVFKKKFCTKEGISSSDEDEVSDSETWRVLFMVVEDSEAKQETIIGISIYSRGKVFCSNNMLYIGSLDETNFDRYTG
jgi:hypothetical protein